MTTNKFIWSNVLRPIQAKIP